MASLGIKRAAWVLLAIAAGGVGFLTGRSQQIQSTIQMLQIEAAGNLIQRIEALSLLRMGDISGATSRLEAEADQLTTSIAGNRGADSRVLAYMKTYLTVAPPSTARAQALSTALDDVPVLEPGQCETALRALLLSARAVTASGDGR